MTSSDAAITRQSLFPEFESDPNDGLEVETALTGDEYEPITEPFDPEQIKIRTIPIVIEQLVSRIKHGELDLTPEFQRLPGVWDVERKSRLIESLLLRIPIPVFYVAAQQNDNWSVVDGLQRMSTIDAYVNGQFALKKLEYLTDFEGYHHDKLPRPMQRRISETQLIINLIEPGTPPEVMYNVFRRINTGGVILNGQEIRHALHPGPVREFLKKLAESKEFIRATDGSINTQRMADRECVLRFLAFHIFPPDQYTNNDLDSLLSKTMNRINDRVDSERMSLATDFKKAMNAAYLIFGRNAFRKPSSTGNRGRVSRALFEVWSVHFARYSPLQLNILVSQKAEIGIRFTRLMRDDSEFEGAISYSTGVPQRVHRRFTAIGRLLEDLV